MCSHTDSRGNPTVIVEDIPETPGVGDHRMICTQCKTEVSGSFYPDHG